MKEELLIKYLLDESNVDETKAVENWIAADEKNQKEFDQIKWVWNSSKVLLEKSEVDEQVAWEKFNKLKARKSASIPKQKQRFLESNWFRAAATVSLILISTWVYTFFLPQSGKAYFGSVELQSESSPVAYPLLDGTAIVLNKNTQLSYTQKLFGKERNVSMDSGEAFFEVKRNEAKPFKIRAEQVEITVLGTSFHVKTNEIATEVIVVTGSVKVQIGESEEVLKPNEKVTVSHESGKMTKSIPENQLYNYYVSKLFQAEGIPLQELVYSLNEAYGTNIKIQGEELKNMPITTTLEYGSLDQNLEVLKETLQLKVSRTADQILIE
ncbi:FecR family protein [Algoriphagus halophytocola]|uniref:FecR domain-containing protein n=1 Tax=Algoriphagus halophytocola TaxID=2991499 RepID=A0ABY6MMM3_9BACT|nr:MULTISPECIES: FecR family protein [unclassified Algoriphagus]UZD23576.1 FecR domain-containing protein [Algoriphagus sp. TR-M5]WBL44870.1 FecR family protein [Algoriphagus sp. TR-M9]